MVDGNGEPIFAEFVVAAMLRKPGLDGAVWVDSYRRCFRDAMPPHKCVLPDHVREVYDRIAAKNGRRAGCWDVIAWKGKRVAFVECKRKGRDRMTANEWQWLESALRSGTLTNVRTAGESNGLFRG